MSSGWLTIQPSVAYWRPSLMRKRISPSPPTCRLVFIHTDGDPSDKPGISFTSSRTVVGGRDRSVAALVTVAAEACLPHEVDLRHVVAEGYI